MFVNGAPFLHLSHFTLLWPLSPCATYPRECRAPQARDRSTRDLRGSRRKRWRTLHAPDGSRRSRHPL